MKNTALGLYSCLQAGALELWVHPSSIKSPSFVETLGQLWNLRGAQTPFCAPQVSHRLFSVPEIFRSLSLLRNPQAAQELLPLQPTLYWTHDPKSISTVDEETRSSLFLPGSLYYLLFLSFFLSRPKSSLSSKIISSWDSCPAHPATLNVYIHHHELVLFQIIFHQITEFKGWRDNWLPQHTDEEEYSTDHLVYEWRDWRWQNFRDLSKAGQVNDRAKTWTNQFCCFPRTRESGTWKQRSEWHGTHMQKCSIFFFFYSKAIKKEDSY